MVILVAFGVGSAYAVLTGSPSKFESNDGNMIVDTVGNSDWSNVAFTHVTDAAASTADNSFTPGQKQDTTCPSVEGHKNPGKDDFTDVASFSETNTTSGDTYLYGATIRYAANGNASENIELKQSSTLCPGQPTGGLTVRTAGDKMIAIDYLNGGTNVQFNVLTWVTSGSCLVGNDVAPCWGSTVITLNAAGAEGLASQAAITAANNPINHNALVAGQFAEFGVNLATAGIIPSGTCKAFPQTVWESRSSGSSFVSSTKDISIENKTISNCGQIIIRKVTVPSPDPNDTSFSYAATGGLSPSSFTLKNGEKQDYGSNVPAGSYGVSETPNANYTLSNIDCSASTLTGGSTVTIGASGGFDAGDTSVSIGLKASDIVDCTYTNTLKTGALKILKESTKTGNPLVANAGAEFCYSTSTGCTVTNVTDNGTGDDNSTTGSVCVSGVALGTYYVNETKAPSGYGGASQTDQSVTVVAGTNCTDNLPAAGATATFTNPPLSDLQVRFRDGGSGETSATISCESPSGTVLTPDTTATAGWGANPPPSGITRTYAGLTPRTVTCTIVIDP
jgi:hypothetical protein